MGDIRKAIEELREALKQKFINWGEVDKIITTLSSAVEGETVDIDKRIEAAAEEIVASRRIDLVKGDFDVTYIIDGKMVEEPEALTAIITRHIERKVK